MNNDKEQTKSLLNKLNSYKIPDDVRVIVAPSYTQLDQSIQMLKDTQISVAAQNMNAASSGAFTGEVSVAMLKSIGVNSVIIGHSERRYGEQVRTQNWTRTKGDIGARERHLQMDRLR